MRIKKRCEAEFRCPNPPFVVIDFKSETIAWKTKRVCVPCARTLLADTIGTDAEAREQEAKDAAMKAPPKKFVEKCACCGELSAWAVDTKYCSTCVDRDCSHAPAEPTR